jgi:orotidine-5'-phosphate decarboxylase
MMNQEAQRARSRLILALDVPSTNAAQAMVSRLGDAIEYYKIGHQLAFCGGLDLARELKQQGKKVFLDLKLLDIDNTVAKGVESVARLGFDMLTIHAYPKAMRAAVAAAAGSSLCLLGVTVLTSMDNADLKEAGYALDATAMVKLRAEQARNAGMGGIVCSPQEAAAMRSILGDKMAVVTPGIRPSGSAPGDQKRIMTPKDAIEAGATHLVIGRPILEAPDPAAAARAVAREIGV